MPYKCRTALNALRDIRPELEKNANIPIGVMMQWAQRALDLTYLSLAPALLKYYEKVTTVSTSLSSLYPNTAEATLPTDLSRIGDAILGVRATSDPDEVMYKEVKPVSLQEFQEAAGNIYKASLMMPVVYVGDKIYIYPYVAAIPMRIRYYRAITPITTLDSNLDIPDMAYNTFFNHLVAIYDEVMRDARISQSSLGVGMQSVAQTVSAIQNQKVSGVADDITKP